MRHHRTTILKALFGMFFGFSLSLYKYTYIYILYLHIYIYIYVNIYNIYICMYVYIYIIYVYTYILMPIHSNSTMVGFLLIIPVYIPMRIPFVDRWSFFIPCIAADTKTIDQYPFYLLQNDHLCNYHPVPLLHVEIFSHIDVQEDFLKWGYHQIIQVIRPWLILETLETCCDFVIPHFRKPPYIDMIYS